MANETFKITSTISGVKFLVRLSENSEGVKLVEFYDTRFKYSTEFGQLVTRYTLDTILKRDLNYGLNLDRGVEAWQIDALSMRLLTREIEDSLGLGNGL